MEETRTSASSVLGPSLLGHVQSGYGLYSADDGRVHVLGKFIDPVQDTVYSQPHNALVPFGFNMHITGPLVKGVTEQVIHGIDNMLVRGVEFIVRPKADKLLQITQIDSGDAKLILRRRLKPKNSLMSLVISVLVLTTHFTFSLLT